jgi:hypothetical protein
MLFLGPVGLCGCTTPTSIDDDLSDGHFAFGQASSVIYADLQVPQIV